MRRRVRVALGSVALLLVAVVAVLLVVTQTDQGRRHVRGILLDRLRSSAHGIVRMGPLRGNLLTGARIDGLVITDSTGAPFFRADTIDLRYSLLALLVQKRIDLANVRLVRPVVVLDRPPGLAWNFARIFPSDSTRPPTRQGFGAWIAVRDLDVEQGRVLVKDAWTPPDSLRGSARDRALAAALSPASRRLVVRVPRGYQSIQEYRQIDGSFDRLRLTHPDSAAMVFDVGRLSLVALPFRPPGVVVRELTGRLISAGDTLVAERLRLALPGSRLTLDGTYLPRAGDLRARVGAPALSLADFRWLRPDLPAGKGTLVATVDRRGLRTRVVAQRMALDVERARLQGHLDVTFGDSLRLGPSDVRFTGVETRLIRRLAPALAAPREGTLDGRLALQGAPAALQVDGDVAFVDRGGARSRLVADGEVGTEGGFRARGLRLRLAPLQLSLLGAAGADLPVGGALTGQATLTGTLRDGFDLRADLAHATRAAGRSRVVADGAILRRAERWFARGLNVRLDPVQMALVRAFRPDLALAGTLEGRARLDGDASDLRLSADLVHRSAATGRSRVVAAGGLALGDEPRARGLRLRLEPVQVALLRAFRPDLPLEGELSGTALLNGSAADLRLAADLVHRSEATGRSHLVASGGVALGEVPRARGLRLRMEPVSLALVRAFRPDLPLDGDLSGTAVLDGTAAELRLAADLVHRSATMGRSHLAARGVVGVGEGFRARDLHLRMAPVQLALLRAFDPALPLDGFLTGEATVNGSTAGRIAVQGSVAHEGSTGRSHLVGRAAAPVGGGRFDVDVRATPLSLATVGRFAPAAGLRGSAGGRIRMSGTMRDAALSLGLTVQGGGRVDAIGRLDLASPGKGYDLRARFGSFDASAVTVRAPATELTGTAEAEGRGTDPATMQARIAADLTGSRIGSTGADSVRVRAEVARGLLALERGTVRLGSMLAEARGSFGLVAGRSGTLDYRVRVDTLARLRGLVPADSGRVPPRPAEIARAYQRARADSVRIARATEVERAATGLPPEPTLRVDSVPALRRDSLAGSLDAFGRLSGNVKRFDVRGGATMRDLVALGTEVGSGTVSYAWLGAPTPGSDLSLDAQLDRVRVRGFLADSVGARVRYVGGRGVGEGTLDLAVRQDPQRDYRARADFTLSPARREVRYSDLALRFDTVTWRATRPGAVSWAGGGVEVRDVELRATDGGRLFVDGRLPADGPADLRVAVERLEIGDVVALLQDSVRVRGKLSLDAAVRGTAASPVMEGTAALAGGVVDTVRVPDADARFAYANRLLRGDARLTREGRELVHAEGRLPIDLAVSGVRGPRLAANAPLVLDVRADSLPLEALPNLTPGVADVRGRVAGTLAVRGTRASPDLRGVVKLDLGSLRVVEPGVSLEELVGTVRIMGDTAVVDSLTALSGGGTIRVAGGLDLAAPTRPGFDLRILVDDARVLDNERGQLRADAELTMTGPWSGARVAGRTRVTRGVIYAPEPDDLQRIDLDAPSVEALGDTAALRVLPRTNALLANLRVDVDVAIEPDTWVRNSQANVEIKTPRETGALRVSMNRATRALALEGSIHTERGEYTFAGRRIRLTRGAAIFDGEAPIDPILQITAEQEVRLPNRPAFNIQLLVGGSMRAPRLTLESNAQPPIAESDLLSYFAFGQPSSSLLQPETGGSIGSGTGGGGLLLGPIGALATQQLGATAVGALVDQLERQTRSSLELDVFNITPAPLPPELAVQGYLNMFRGARFEAGRYLSNRWFVATQGRAAAVLPGLLLEYRTPAGFQWVTSWEPRFLTQPPSLAIPQRPTSTNVFGLFLQWQRRF